MGIRMSAKLFLACAALIASCSRREPPPVVASQVTRCPVSARAVATDSGVGQLRVKAPISSIGLPWRVLRDTTELGDEAQPERVLTVATSCDTVTAVVDEDGGIHHITISSNAIRTSDSLGVGTPLARLVRIEGARGVVGENVLHVRAGSHCGLSFQFRDLDLGDQPPETFTVQELRRLPPTALVTTVLVIGCRDRAPA